MWTFFDSISAQTANYPDYLFEDKVADILKNNPDLKKKLDDAKDTRL